MCGGGGGGNEAKQMKLLMVYIFFGVISVFSWLTVLRRSCREVFQEANIYNTPHYINVDFATGRTLNNWIDSLSASFAGVQVTCGVLGYNR